MKAWYAYEQISLNNVRRKGYCQINWKLYFHIVTCSLVYYYAYRTYYSYSYQFELYISIGISRYAKILLFKIHLHVAMEQLVKMINHLLLLRCMKVTGLHFLHIVMSMHVFNHKCIFCFTKVICCICIRQSNDCKNWIDILLKADFYKLVSNLENIII